MWAQWCGAGVRDISWLGRKPANYVLIVILWFGIVKHEELGDYVTIWDVLPSHSWVLGPTKPNNDMRRKQYCKMMHHKNTWFRSRRLRHNPSWLFSQSFFIQYHLSFVPFLFMFTSSAEKSVRGCPNPYVTVSITNYNNPRREYCSLSTQNCVFLSHWNACCVIVHALIFFEHISDPPDLSAARMNHANYCLDKWPLNSLHLALSGWKSWFYGDSPLLFVNQRFPQATDLIKRLKGGKTKSKFVLQSLGEQLMSNHCCLTAKIVSIFPIIIH